MKKHILTTLLSICCMITAGAFFVSCKKTEEGERVITEEQVEAEKKLELNAYSINLEKAEVFELTASIDGDVAQNVLWKSVKSDIASVTNGNVKALSAGSTVIIATSGDLETRCIVTVSDNGLIPGISTNVAGDELCLMQGDEFTLVTQVTYNGVILTDAVTEVHIQENGAVTYENGKLIANAIGSTLVTVNATWNGVSCQEYVFAVSVVGNTTARLYVENTLTLYNDENGGVVMQKLSPSLMVDDTMISREDYEIISWEYDEKIISVGDETVTGICKGNTDLIATFKVKDSGVKVACVLPVSVCLYTYDMSETVRLDTLYLDKESYMLKINDVFFDKNDLKSCAIETIRDVTNEKAYNVPFEKAGDRINAIIDIKEASALGMSGDRKWQVDCGKYSYIITVPTQLKHYAAPLLGDYQPNNWTNSITLSFVDNKDRIDFKDENGNTVASGLFTLTPWDNAQMAGTIKITIENGALYAITDTKYANVLKSFSGHYYYQNNCYQLHICVGYYCAENIVHYYRDIQAPYGQLAGIYEKESLKLTINENKTFDLEIDNTTQTGNCVLIPDKNNPLTGQIVLGDAYTGSYSYDKGGANITIAWNGVQTTLVRAGDSGEPYGKYAGYYESPDETDSGGVWIRLRLEADGTFAWCFEYYSRYSTIGTYEMKDGIIVLTPENKNTGYGAQFIGTYYEQDGKYYVKINLLGERIYERK